MAERRPFNPYRGTNRVTTPAAGSASISLVPVAKSVRLVNSGAQICYVRIGTGAQTATTADTPILAGTSLIVNKADGEDTLAHISAVGTTLHVQEGEGGI